MITDDPKASDVIIEEGKATPMFFSFIDQVTQLVNTLTTSSGLVTVEDEGTPLTTALAKLNFVGSGVTATEPVDDEITVTVSSGGDMLSTNDLSDVNDVAQARVNLGVDPAGTDNSTNVTLVGAGDYLSLSGQQITQRELTDDDITMIQLNKEVDFVGDTVIYIGEATPGTGTGSALWRVKRVTFTGDDSETLWADGDANFDNTWTGRAGFTYS